MMVSEGAEGDIAWSASRRFGITEQEFPKRSLNKVMAKHMFEA